MERREPHEAVRSGGQNPREDFGKEKAPVKQTLIKLHRDAREGHIHAKDISDPAFGGDNFFGRLW